jgi:molybdate transport system substrate-binding protein
MSRRFFLFLLALLAIAPVTAQTTLKVAAAADLEPVLPPIIEQFHKQTGITVQPSFGASGALTTQILNGAPFDIFFAADTGYPKKLLDAGVATSGEGSTGPVVYAKGTLVLWTRKDSKLPAPSIEMLKNPALQRLAIANPERAPYGRAAVAALKSLGLYEALQPKFVIAENIGQTAQFAETGNADAGLISKTSAVTAKLSAVGSYFVVPANLYPALEQGAVIMTKSPERAAAQKFLNFMLSPTVQAHLSKSGLTAVR